MQRDTKSYDTYSLPLSSLQSQRENNVCALKKFFFLCPHNLAWGILLPQPVIEPTPPTAEAWTVNHWTSREIPVCEC